MSDNSNNKPINETLNIIRKALQEDNSYDGNEEKVLILNNLINDDGTISKINTEIIEKQEIKNILDEKFSEVFEQHFEKWLKKNLPVYLEKYFSKKEK